LVNIDAYIRAGSYPSVDALCRTFEVQPRTVHQDIKELREHFHLDIRFDRARGGYYNATPSQRLPQPAATEEQSLTTLIALEMFCHFGGPAFRGILASAIDGIAGENDSALARKLEKVIQFNPKKRFELNPNVFCECIHACVESRLLKILFRGKRHEVTARNLLFADGEWWLVAEERGKPIRLELGAIEKVESV
jgi:predicted DNA-binding transcriptional regulator YafY